jgi:hypothetical protein
MIAGFSVKLLTKPNLLRGVLVRLPLEVGFYRACALLIGKTQQQTHRRLYVCMHAFALGKHPLLYVL